MRTAALVLGRRVGAAASGAAHSARSALGASLLGGVPAAPAAIAGFATAANNAAPSASRRGSVAAAGTLFAASAAFATASGALPASGPAQAKEAVPMVRASPRREPEIRTPREPSRAFESCSRSLTTDSSSYASFTPPRSLLSIRPSSRSRR